MMTREEKLLVCEHRARAEMSKGKTVAITPADLIRICNLAMRNAEAESAPKDESAPR